MSNPHESHTPRYAAPIISVGMLVTGGIMGLTNFVKLREANTPTNVGPAQTQTQTLDNASTYQQQPTTRSSSNYYVLPVPQAGPASSGFSGGQQFSQQSSGSH